MKGSTIQDFELLDKAFYASPCLMAISTISDGCYIKVNRFFEEFTGYYSDEAVGCTSVELNIFDVPTRKRVAELLAMQGTIRNEEANFRTKDGRVSIGLFFAEIINYNGQQCILSVAMNITDLKRYEKEVSKYERLNLIGQMAAGIGHEIRNPLTSVRGYLQLFGSKPQCSDHKEIFDLMISELDRANAIITEFLTLAKTKPSKPKNKNLNDIITKLYPLIEADTFTQNKQILLRQAKLPYINVDEDEISQLILNLTRNGLESMEENKLLTIETYVEDKEVVLKFQDQGSGIPPEIIDQLGIPFFTTKDNGTGLGLATSYRIAESHNAMIEVESNNKGTTFLVRFPIIDLG